MNCKAKIMACLLTAAAGLGLTHVSAEAARHAADRGSDTIVDTSGTRGAHGFSGKTSEIRTGRTAPGSSTLNRTQKRASEEAAAGGKTPVVNLADGSLRFNPTTQDMREWAVDTQDTGGTLIFSDSPEYVDTNGILYEDTVTGDARVLYYHLNNTGARKKVAVVLQNEGKDISVVRVTRGGSGRPSRDYLEVGKSTQLAYFQKKRDDTVYVLSQEKRLLDPLMNEIILEPGQLVYGVYDFHATGPVKVSVIMYPAVSDPLKFIKHARVLPKDEQRLRGTFRGMDRVISSKPYDPEKDGVVYIPIGDNRQDVFRTGIDATDGSRVTNVGNYGVLYRIQIPTVGREATQYYLTPLGGVYAGAMSVDFGHGPNLLETPGGRAYFGDAIPPDSDADRAARLAGKDRLKEWAELADLGSYHSSVQPSFELSPPGASNLPVQIILMPAGE